MSSIPNVKSERVCECGCGRSLTYSRSDARFYEAGCRVRANKKKNGKTRVFVGLDGEASGDDYCLLAAGAINRHVFKREGLSTVDCLEFLLSLPRGSRSGKRAIYVWFAFDYDVNMILKDLPQEGTHHSIEELRKTHETTWRGYKIRYIRRKILSIRKGFRSFNSYDVWAFFAKSFEGSLESWDIKVPKIISEGKKARGSFARWSEEKIIAYNKAELNGLEELCTKLRDSITPLDLTIKSWHGPGSLASAWLEKNRVREWLPAERLDPKLEDAAYRAYFGGRIDTQGFGIVDPVYHYDIVSAYPSAIRFLPNLNKLKWRHEKGNPSVGGIYVARIRWKIPATLWAPFPWRNSDGSIRYPESGEGWYWNTEIEAAQKRFPSLSISFLEHYYAEGTIELPFRSLIEEAFAYRNELKKQGHPSNIAVKLILNSLYGKFAQTVGKAKFFSPIWAGMITAHCRAQLMSVLTDDVVLTMTDSIWSKSPLPVEESSELGGWERGEESRLAVCMAGLYKATKPDGTESVFQRGFDKSIPIDLEKTIEAWNNLDFDSPHYEPSYTVHRFVGMNLAAMTDYPWGKWVDIKRTIHPVPFWGTTKRYGVSDDSAPLEQFNRLELREADKDACSFPYSKMTKNQQLILRRTEDECSEVVSSQDAKD